MAYLPVVAAGYWDKKRTLVAGHHLLLQYNGQYCMDFTFYKSTQMKQLFTDMFVKSEVASSLEYYP